MMTERSAVELLRAASGRRVVDEDGNESVITLLPPLSADELATLERRIPCALPPDARELLSFARSFDGGPLESLDFAGDGEPMMEEAFPCALPIAHDGFGNYWVVDLVSDSSAWGPIFFLCHDPAVVIYQCADVATFIADVLRMAEPPYAGPIDDVHERHATEMWRTNTGAVARDEAVRSSEPVVRDFAEQLTSDYFIVDLRNARTGDGFSWGRFGPQTVVCRAGEARIFAYQSRSRLSRLRGFFTGR
jgi:hypothetical protein